MTVQELKIGQSFKWGSRQKKWRSLKKKIELPEDFSVEKDRGKLLLIFDDCRMIALAKDQEVFIKQ